MIDGAPSTDRRTLAQPRSDALWERATRVIPGGSQTFSKGPSQVAPGSAPKYLAKGEGCHVWDVDGHEYLDYTMGLLPLILGYAHPRVNAAVEAQLRDGSTFSLMHPLEVEVAERVAELVPCAEMVRFAKNGSDATAGAVRLARAHTGRDVIACCGYHGWQDWFIGTTTRDRGVPDAVKRLTEPFAFNDLRSLEAVFERHDAQVAAVIMEPVTFEPPAPGFLEQVAGLARRNGAILVFDEIITGFRFSMGGAQELFGVTPDLATFGKSVANGFPLSLVAGRAELMKGFEEVFFSFTFGGEPISLAAAKATLDELGERDGPAYLWRVGRRLKDGVEELISSHGLERTVSCPGLDVWTCLTFEGDDPYGAKTLFQQECIKRGVLFMANHNTSLAHTEADIDRTLEVYGEAMGVLSTALEQDRIDDLLEGPRVEPVFRGYH